MLVLKAGQNLAVEKGRKICEHHSIVRYLSSGISIRCVDRRFLLDKP